MLTLNINYEVLPDRLVTIKLPETVSLGRHELVIVLEEDTTAENTMIREDVLTEIRRRPSPKLKGTRILGDIMSPAVPETDWDVLQ